LPLAFVLMLLISAIIVFGKAGFEGKGIVVPALLVNLFCIPALFSPAWPYVLLIAIATYCVVLWSGKMQTPYVLFFAVIVFAIFIGGIGLGYLFVSGGDQTLVSSGVSGGSPYQSVVALQQTCASYYGTFWVDNQFIPWDSATSTGSGYVDYCSVGWIAAIQFFHVLIVVFYFLMMAGVVASSSEAGAEGGRKGDAV